MLQDTIEGLKKKSFEENNFLLEENERLKMEFRKLTSEIGDVYLEHSQKLNDKINDLRKADFLF